MMDTANIDILRCIQTPSSDLIKVLIIFFQRVGGLFVNVRFGRNSEEIYLRLGVRILPPFFNGVELELQIFWGLKMP